MIDLICNRDCKTWGIKLAKDQMGDMFLWCAAISAHPAIATVVVTSKGGH
jgi:hypothetical protein